MQRVRRTVLLVRPERATVRDDIELVEQFAAIPRRLGLVLDIRFLPGINLVAPALVVTLLAILPAPSSAQ